jgi:hypothetical protein
MVYKLLSTYTPHYLGMHLKSYNPLRTLRSSAAGFLELPSSRIKTAERRFSCAGPLAWNSLPAKLKNIDNLSTFRKELKKFLFVKKHYLRLSS